MPEHDVQSTDDEPPELVDWSGGAGPCWVPPPEETPRHIPDEVWSEPPF